MKFTQQSERGSVQSNRQHMKKRKRKKPLVLRILGHIGSVIAVTFLSFFLIFCITGSICAVAATAYVMNYMESTTTVSIQEMIMGYSTNVYVTNPDGEQEAVYTVENAVQRIPVDLEVVPQHVRNAFVYGEDERFYSHEGVDYKRTLAAFANLVLEFWATEQGGSTITQQLVKNLTGDNETSPLRKIREIFRAMQLEKRYNKDEILEAYLNYIGFGGAANGVEKAAQKYFGKSVSDISVAEAACLAAIPQSPEVNNPFAGHYEMAENKVTGTTYRTDVWVNTGREINRARMEYILFQMYDNGAITYDEYQEALAEELLFTDTEEYKALHPELEEEEQEEKEEYTSWVVDAALNEFAEYLMEERGVSEQRAFAIINSGGFQIYTTVDVEMQNYVEEKYSDLNNLLKGMTTADRTVYYRDLDGDGVSSFEESMSLQSGFTAIDYAGNILCTVGGIGEKKASLGISYANTEPQQPGSAIKPVSTYGYALSNDYLTWSTKVLDYPPLKINNKPWPTNYSTNSNYVKYSNSKIMVYTAIQDSYNTIPALLCKTYGVDNVYGFATGVAGLDLVESNDMDYAPLSVGALYHGITVEDLVNAYMIYGNGGYFSDAHIISRVETSDGNLVYTGGADYTAVIDEETAYVMNKLLQNVVNNGTGKAAKLSANGKVIPLAAKTGTTSDWYDLMFMALNPDFVSGVWIGYPENKEIRNHFSIASPKIWKNIIGEWIQTHYSGEEFPACDSVITARVCTETGKIAVEGCPTGVTGYWKSTNAPYCDGHESALAAP
ncbi:MAG: transglycosylase domain-containing protein [Oscillospiraceae bacterium]|nr:transglycosylase domain-containing protein [Oscillospiraceae bacterium]